MLFTELSQVDQLCHRRFWFLTLVRHLVLIRTLLFRPKKIKFF